jgi:peptidyl-Lys metalloendopeptidase
VALLLGGCLARPPGDVTALTVFDTSCSAEQRAMIDDAVHTARRRLAQAVQLVRQHPRHPHVRAWFGNAPPHLVLATLEATASAIVPPLAPDLHCNDALHCTPDRIAYSSPEHVILAVCPRFFAAPAEGLDSRYGTLIHEMTHLASGTNDYAYQPREAARLSKVAPVRAANNADNYQYFVETLPR